MSIAVAAGPMYMSVRETRLTGKPNFGSSADVRLYKDIQSARTSLLWVSVNRFHINPNSPAPLLHAKVAVVVVIGVIVAPAVVIAAQPTPAASKLFLVLVFL
ncbi:unnamed protein product [Sphagnum balticum]